MSSPAESTRNHDDLGELVDVVGISLGFKLASWIGAILALIAGVGAVVLFKVNPATGIEPSTVYTIAAAFIFGGVVVLAAMLFYSKLHYEIYRNGVIRDNRSNRDTVMFGEVTQYRDTLNGIEFQLRDGTSKFWSLGPIRDTLGFRDRISNQVCERLWPAVKEAFLKGEKITLDDMAMDREKIAYKNDELPWTQISEIKVVISSRGSTLYIWRKGTGVAFCELGMGHGKIANHFLIEKVLGIMRPDLLQGPEKGLGAS
jgi:hypothetical protein